MQDSEIASLSMDFQLSLKKKKIKCVAILINFLQRFEIMHKIQFSSVFFEKVENLTKLQFFCSFFEIIVSPKWAFWMLTFDFERSKIFFQGATDMINSFLMSITWYNASFSKTGVFHLKIACFLQKMWDFRQFLV